MLIVVEGLFAWFVLLGLACPCPRKRVRPATRSIGLRRPSLRARAYDERGEVGARSQDWATAATVPPQGVIARDRRWHSSPSLIRSRAARQARVPAASHGSVEIDCRVERGRRKPHVRAPVGCSSRA